MDVNVFRRGLRKAKPMPTEEIDEESKGFLAGWSASQTAALRDTVVSLRKERLRLAGTTPEQLQADCFDRPFADPERLASLGLIDGVESLESFRARTTGPTKELRVGFETRKAKYGSAMNFNGNSFAGLLEKRFTVTVAAK